MSRYGSEEESRLSRRSGDEDRGRSLVGGLEDSLRSSSGLLLAGLVAAGLGALAWYYLGPDIRRYMKIRDM